jgi:K+-sensing histidine kinase KdpD
VLLIASRNLQHARAKTRYDRNATQILKLLGRPVILYPISSGTLDRPLMMYPQGKKFREIGDSTCEPEGRIADWVYLNNEQAGATPRTIRGEVLVPSVRGDDNVHAVAVSR